VRVQLLARRTDELVGDLKYIGFAGLVEVRDFREEVFAQQTVCSYWWRSEASAA